MLPICPDCGGKKSHVAKLCRDCAKKSGVWVKNSEGQFKKGMTPWNKIGGGITPKDKLERKRFRREIQKQVFERDNYTCQFCGEMGGSLQVDHIQSWKDYVELRFDIKNCRTLCMACHYELTFNKPIPKDTKTWGHNLKKV